MAISWSTVLVQGIALTPHSQAVSLWMMIREGFKCWQILWLLCLGEESRYECYFLPFTVFLFSWEKSDMFVWLHVKNVISDSYCFYHTFVSESSSSVPSFPWNSHHLFQGEYIATNRERDTQACTYKHTYVPNINPYFIQISGISHYKTGITSA